MRPWCACRLLCLARCDARVLRAGLCGDLWTLRGLGADDEAASWIPLELPGSPPSARKGAAMAGAGTDSAPHELDCCLQHSCPAAAAMCCCLRERCCCCLG